MNMNRKNKGTQKDGLNKRNPLRGPWKSNRVTFMIPTQIAKSSSGAAVPQSARDKVDDICKQYIDETKTYP